MRSLPLLVALLAWSAVTATSSGARAAEYPEEYSQRPQTLPQKMLELRSGFALSLPASDSPRPTAGFGFRWGITDRFEFELGAAFTNLASTLVDAESASVRGILWHSDAVSLSLGGGIQLLGPTGGQSALSSFVDVGFYARLGDRAGLRISAGVANPLTYRDTFVDTYGLTVEPSFNITSAFAAYGSVEARAAFRDSETATAGAKLGLLYTLDTRFDFAASFGMPNLVSRSGISTDARAFALEVRLRLDCR